MYHSRFFFFQLGKALNSVLKGSRLQECFSQEKDELVVHFIRINGDALFIRANLSPSVCILTFPEELARRRSNSVDLFPELEDLQVEEVETDPNDRLFRIRFESGWYLTFKMYGMRSNVLLHKQENLEAIFNHHLKKDRESLPVFGESKPDDLRWHANPEELKNRCKGFTKRMWQIWFELEAKLPANEKENRFEEFVSQLLHPDKIHLCRDAEEVFLSFFPVKEVLFESSDPLALSNRYYRLFWQVNQFLKEKQKSILSLREKLLHVHDQVILLESKVQMAAEESGYRKQADLLMAYGQGLSPGLEQVSFPDFESGEQVIIRLKKDLSIIANAERLYRKARGQAADLARLENNLSVFRKRYENLMEILQKLEHAASMKEMQQAIPESSHFIDIAGSSATDGPFHLIQFMHYEIRVGKNARSNDELLRLSHKDDLWFHARDVPGSHVVIRVKKSQNTPHPVCIRAAELAAHHSKAAKEMLVPVMMTERKYVRKIKGGAPGQVRVEKEKTLLVEPRQG